MSDKLPRMDYRQHRRARARRLVHECCNYNEGNWPQPSYTEGAGNGVPSAARPLSPNPTGGNTAPTVPDA